MVLCRSDRRGWGYEALGGLGKEKYLGSGRLGGLSVDSGGNDWKIESCGVGCLLPARAWTRVLSRCSYILKLLEDVWGTIRGSGRG